MVKILITGSRDWDDYETIYKAIQVIILNYPNEERHLIHGGAKGADMLSGKAAAKMGFDSIKVVPADWEQHGKRAGFIRNSEMVKMGADFCLAFIKNESRGATMTADLAEVTGIVTKRFMIKE